MAYARNKKNVNDKFYTKEGLAKSLIGKIDLSRYGLIIEPSAGSGAFSRNMQGNVLALDIDPEGTGILKQDWLEYELPEGFAEDVIVIGNPPFGNQGALALKFIKKSASLGAAAIAFILPKSFKKESVQNKVPSMYHLAMEIDLDEASFELEGKPYSVPCVFQVWERKSQKREIRTLKSTSELFSFVKKADAHDFAFRRVGFYAGRTYSDTHDKAEQSHYFIKSEVPAEDLISAMASIEWEHNNTAGPRSIGKKELIERVEREIKRR